MANYQIKLVLRPELVLRSSSYLVSKVTQCVVEVSMAHTVAPLPQVFSQ